MGCSNSVSEVNSSEGRLVHNRSMIRSREVITRTIGTGKAGSSDTEFDRPLSCAVLPNGLVAVCDFCNHRVCIVNVTTGKVVKMLGNGKGAGRDQMHRPAGVCALKNGTIVVSDHGNHRLQVIDPMAGLFIRSIGNGKGSDYNQLSYPAGIIALPDGNVAVCDHSHRIQIVDPHQGTFLCSIGRPGVDEGCFDRPADIALLPNGHLAVTDCGNHRLHIIELCPSYRSRPPPTTANHDKDDDKPFQFLRIIGGEKGDGPNQFCFPAGLCLLPNGNLMICDIQNHRLQEVDPRSGKFIRLFGGARGNGKYEFDHPAGICVMPDTHHLVVCDYKNHRVKLLDVLTDWVRPEEVVDVMAASLISPEVLPVGVLDTVGEYLCLHGQNEIASHFRRMHKTVRKKAEIFEAEYHRSIQQKPSVDTFDDVMPMTLLHTPLSTNLCCSVETTENDNSSSRIMVLEPLDMMCHSRQNLSLSAELCTASTGLPFSVCPNSPSASFPTDSRSNSERHPAVSGNTVAHDGERVEAFDVARYNLLKEYQQERRREARLAAEQSRRINASRITR